uniref:t-SNARE affecting a late Golgi compartment protein 2 n=1 Tax=Talaromyces marneffei PM1 TaxID=1077442 RepID=A0A093V3C2_TALMA
MWRDRTNLYISYRQSFAHHPTKKPRYFGPSQGFTDSPSLSEERRGLIAGADGLEDDGDAIIEMDLLPPRWVDVQEEVSEVLADIAQKSARLDKLHQKHILPSFGDEGVRKEEEAIIEQYTQEITRSFHACQNAIQRIDGLVREQKQLGAVTKGDETMAKNIQISLAARVQEASARFRKKQSTYLRKLRELEGMASPFERVSTPIQSQYSDPSLMESDADKSFSQTTLQQTSQKQQQQLVVSGANDVAIAQREREINDIAKGIIELSDIFRELQTMIIDQGTMLDRIDYNVERMATDVKQADTELKVVRLYSLTPGLCKLADLLE